MEWSVDHASPVPQLREADVEDLDELKRALEQMAETATNGPPLVVELVGPTGGRLGIGLGPLGSVLSFKASDDPPYFLSAGTTRSLSDEVVGFYYHGHWTEFSGSSLVAYEKAQEAAQLFFSTGERPDNVQWEEV